MHTFTGRSKVVFVGIVALILLFVNQGYTHKVVAQEPPEKVGLPLSIEWENDQKRNTSSNEVTSQPSKVTVTDSSGDVGSLKWLKPHPRVRDLTISGNQAWLSFQQQLISIPTSYIDWYTVSYEYTPPPPYEMMDRIPDSSIKRWVVGGSPSSSTDGEDSSLQPYQDLTYTQVRQPQSPYIEFLWQLRGEIPSGTSQPNVYYYYDLNYWDYGVFLYPTVRGWEWEVDAFNSSFGLEPSDVHDIVEASVEYPNAVDVKYSITLSGNVPDHPYGSMGYPWFNWKINVDKDTSTGQQPLGDEANVVVRYHSDPEGFNGWKAVVRFWNGLYYQDFCDSDDSSCIKEFSRSGNTVSVTVDRNLMLGDESDFWWYAGSAVIVNPGYIIIPSDGDFSTDADCAPNSGWLDSPSPTPSLPDLDVSKQLPYVQTGLKSEAPYTTTLAIKVENKGDKEAKDVIVEFYDGDPDIAGSTAIGTTTIDSIVSSGAGYASIPWRADHQTKAEVYVKVRLESGDEKDNSNNKTAGVRMNAYYADFRYNPNTYKFENPPLEWSDFWSLLGSYYASNLPPDLMYTVQDFVMPFIFTSLGKDSGVCYGMAQASIVFWEQKKNIYGLGESEAMPDIIKHHSLQILQAANYQPRWTNVQQDIVGEYNYLLSTIKAGKPAILSIDSDTNHHSMTAYKIVEVGKDEKKVFVYDNARPMVHSITDTNDLAIFDTNKETFTYDSKPYSVTVALPVENFVEATYYIIKLHERRSRDLIASDKTQVFLGSPATLLLTDEYGRQVGYDDQGALINEVPGAATNDLGGALLFEVPADLQYEVTTLGTGSGTLNLSYLLPIGGNWIQEVIYTDVPVSPGSSTTSNLSKTTEDWTMTLGSGQILQPSHLRKVDVSNNIYLPLILKEKI